MKKNITLRAEWVIATLALPQAIKLIVLEAILAYIVNGYITEIPDPQAAEVFATIKADIDVREAKKRERAEKRAAQKVQSSQSPQKAHAIPGYLPDTPPADLDERVKADPIVEMAIQDPIYAEFADFEKPLVAELCLQITDSWRSERSDIMPSFTRLCREFDERFADAACNIHNGKPISRDTWRSHIARYDTPKL
ncbi:MAG: hypothetical protein HFJ94_03170 [Muribaculaceae bacterium]|nr:hypothetical protein [Muribaculaceae bacterium]